MLQTVPCSNSNCIYQNDGLCMLDTAKAPTEPKDTSNGCLYYCTNEYIARKNQLKNSRANAENKITPFLKQSSSISKDS